VAAELADVDVLTTCAGDHLTWQNEMPPGETCLNGVLVRRFPVEHKFRDRARYEALHLRLIQRELLAPDEQYEWVEQSAHSPEMYAYLEDRGGGYQTLIFAPYLFGTTYYGSAIHPKRSVLWPCLHDEIYAYLTPTRDMYQGCLGVMFNTYPEMRLAERLYGPHAGGQIVGFGLSSFHTDGECFRKQYNLDSPFILYSGRLESAKNVPLLIQYFLEYRRRHDGPLKLVLMGRGPESIPPHRDIVTVGFKQGQEKLDAYAAATLLCQPSVNESFSIVIMESWLSGVPVVVHADCEVTRYHVVRSNGGLYFRSFDEFEAVLSLLLNDEQLRRQLSVNGEHYVHAEYGWDTVLQRFESALERWSALRQ